MDVDFVSKSMTWVMGVPQSGAKDAVDMLAKARLQISMPVKPAAHKGKCLECHFAQLISHMCGRVNVHGCSHFAVTYSSSEDACTIV